MSKALKKLIDINGLREFKNKLVGTDSAYVQTGAVDQTIAGTKTFSKPIAGSVTGSSGSCTGNAATATKATQDAAGNTITTTYATKAENNTKANNSEVVHKSGDETIAGTKTFSNGVLSTAVNAFMAQAGGYTLLLRNDSQNTYLLMSDKDGAPGTWSDARPLTINNSTGVCNINGSAASATNANHAKSADSATKLAAKRTIALSGAATGTATGFDGTGNIAIPVTSLDASKLTGTASVSTTGNAATATRANSAANADTATNATNATNSNAANQLQAFVNDNFTEGNHYVKAIRSTFGWSTHLWMCYNNGGKMADEVSVNYANSAGSANTANSATNATYANWLRTSSHTDHLFHTEWDNAGYFWTYVTAGDGGYRAVRVARSDRSGNADTATKLATARTIALSGAATGTATGFDGSGNITIPVTSLDASKLSGLAAQMKALWYAGYPDGAEAHNAMWGGRDITAAFNNGTVSTNIANGTFRDIFPGDYITKQVTISGTTYTVNWVVADCDYWINKGDTSVPPHHVVIVPQAPIFYANMNATNTTEGCYKGSEMFKKIIPAVATGLVNAFGSSHILTFRDRLTHDLNTSAISSGITTWTGAPNWHDESVSVQCNLMSEAMVYDGPHCASSALDNVMATRQMSAFRLSEKLINYNRQSWWLRDIVSSAFFAFVYVGGTAGTDAASTVRGVRPFALLV